MQAAPSMLGTDVDGPSRSSNISGYAGAGRTAAVKRTRWLAERDRQNDVNHRFMKYSTTSRNAAWRIALLLYHDLTPE